MTLPLVVRLRVSGSYLPTLVIGYLPTFGDRRVEHDVRVAEVISTKAFTTTRIDSTRILACAASTRPPFCYRAMCPQNERSNATGAWRRTGGSSSIAPPSEHIVGRDADPGWREQAEARARPGAASRDASGA